VWHALRPWLFPVWCIGCGLPDIGLCPACAATAEPLTLTVAGVPVRAAGVYDGVVRDAILALKRGERAYLDPLATLLAPLVEPGSAIVPLRTSRRRSGARGFDQAVELAKRVAGLRAGWVDDVLQKRGPAQHGSGRAGRFSGPGRFHVRAGAAVPSEATVLDDVLTTGATLCDALDALTGAGCRVRDLVVVARTPPGRETPRRGNRLLEA
jgi:predicted amidophosphoribosyltransferase